MLVPLAVAVAAAVVVSATVVVATGRGGELASSAPGTPGPRLPADRPLDAADLFGIRLPRRVVGYRTDDVDVLLHWVAHSLAERDARLALLERRLAEIHAHEQARARAARVARDSVHNAEETW